MLNKKRIAIFSFSIILMLYSSFVFFVWLFPRLTNLNDSFFFFNWIFIPIVSILLLISWVLCFRNNDSFRILRIISLITVVLWLLALILFYFNFSLPYIDILLNTQPLLSLLFMLFWMIAARKDYIK